MAGVNVPCLLDTGSMVSTVTESFFLQNFGSWGNEKLQTCRWLQLRAANGLDIPYIGYLELDVEVLGKLIPGRGVLVVKDPPSPCSTQKILGILGMNIIRECYEELFGQHSSALFDTPLVRQQTFQYCHQASNTPGSVRKSMVKVRSGNVIRIPGGTIKMVATTCSQYYFDSPGAVLFEPLTNSELLAAGLLVSPAMVKVFKGTAYILVVNVGTTETLLYPHTRIGVLSQVHIVSLSAGITEMGGEPSGSVTATASSHAVEHRCQTPVLEGRCICWFSGCSQHPWFIQVIDWLKNGHTLVCRP